jgi:type II secretory pathway component GspD/PulD (secretin)
MNNKIIFILIAALLSGACGPKQAVRQESVPSAAQPAEEQRLSEILPAKDSVDEKKPERQAAEKKQEEQYVMLNFENADLETVVATIAEMLKINYILAPGVTGKITIQSHNKIPLSELFSTFQTTLEFNGFTAVKDGSFYRIVPIDTAKQQPVPVRTGKNIAPSKDAGFVTQEIPLEYVKASDIANVVRNLMPRGTDIVIYEPSNMLIVTAPPQGILKFLKLIETIDIPSTERDSVKTFVYPVENGEAKKLADILKTIYGKKGTTAAPTPQPATSQRTVTQPQPQQRASLPARTLPQPVVSAAAHEGVAGELDGDVLIEAYDDINALLIKATPRGYITLLETIKKLDIQPKQVLIEVLVAEISLDDSISLGLEWLIKTDNEKFGVDILGGFARTPSNFFKSVTDTTVPGVVTTVDLTKFVPVVADGGFLNVLNPNRFNSLITAAAATGKVNVLASPHILAIDNKEAKIEIGDEVPVATSITSASVDANDTTNTTSQVQFKSVGTILTVTPHINEKKQVTLKVSQEVSELGNNVKIGSQDFTGFKTRKANTTAIVQDGHTLVIGGIISERIGKSRTGIPFLSSIPLLGYLFGVTKDEIQKRELILLITPHVVADRDEADALTEDYKSRVKNVKERIEERQKKLNQADIHFHKEGQEKTRE